MSGRIESESAVRAKVRRVFTVEAAISRFKRTIGDALCSRTHRRQVTEVAIAVIALNPRSNSNTPGPSAPRELEARLDAIAPTR